MSLTPQESKIVAKHLHKQRAHARRYLMATVFISLILALLLWGLFRKGFRTSYWLPLGLQLFGAGLTYSLTYLNIKKRRRLTQDLAEGEKVYEVSPILSRSTARDLTTQEFRYYVRLGSGQVEVTERLYHRLKEGTLVQATLTKHSRTLLQIQLTQIHTNTPDAYVNPHDELPAE